MEKSATIGTPVRWACSLPKKPLSWSDQLPTYKLVVGGVWARAPSPFSFSRRSLCRDPTPPFKTLPYNIDSQWAILDALDPARREVKVSAFRELYLRTGEASPSSSRSPTRPPSSTWTASTSSSCASRTGSHSQ